MTDRAGGAPGRPSSSASEVSSEPIVSEGASISDAGEGPVATAWGVPVGLDRYERRQLVGVGGMGRVSVAYDRVLGREVALKEPGPGHGPALLEEARRAAALEHPGIVPVFDLGVGPDGAPWYTMRLLRGRPLEEALHAEPDLSGRLGWLRAVLAACEAVAYAHARGVVHRDLTPSNLLLGDLGEACVADWGLAALSGAHGAGGTPGYRAPEQEAGGAVDARADVYALGAVLFRLCAGVPTGPGVTLPRATPPELATIVGRATAPDRADRYPDARALAEDLAAFLDGRRVSAYPYSPWELLRRLVVAWRAPLAVGAAAAAILVVTASRQHLATVRERDRAVAAERAASANLGLTLAAHAAQALRAGAVGEAAVLAAHAVARTSSADPKRPETEPAFAAFPEGGGPVAEARAHAMGVLAAAAAAAPAEASTSAPLPPGCGEARLSGEALICLGPDEASAWSVDGRTRTGTWPGRFVDAAIHARTGRAVLLDAAGVVRIDGLPFDTAAEGRAYRFDLVGDTLVALDGADIREVDLRSGAERLTARPCPASERLLALALHADGRLAAGCSGGGVYVGRGGAFAPTAARLPDPTVLAWLDGDLLAGTVRGEVVRLGLDGVERWRVPTERAALLQVGALGADGAWARGPRGTWLLDAATGSLRAVLPFSGGAPTLGADGLLRALGAGDGGATRAVRAWRLPARWPATVLSTARGLSAIAASPDGATLALGDGDVYRWDVATGAVARTALPDAGVVKALAWAPDGGRVLASVSGPNDLYVVDAAGALVEATNEVRTLWRRLAWLADGTRVGLGYGAGVTTWDGRGNRTDLPAGPGSLHDLGLGVDRAAAAMLDDAGGVWRLAGAPLVAAPLGTLPDAHAVDLGPRGRVVVATTDAVVVLHEGGQEALRWSIAPRTVVDVAWSPDGAWIATGSLGGMADVWDANTGALLATLAGHTDRVAAVEFAPDGTWLATASWDHTARRWSLAPLRGPPPVPAEVEARWGLSLEETLVTARW